MNGNLGEVFNTYNVNILFTVAALPARVALAGGPPGLMMPPPQNQIPRTPLEVQPKQQTPERESKLTPSVKAPGVKGGA